jgi:hypothetical protein
VRRYLLSAVFASIVAACGCGDRESTRGITEPTTTKEVIVHNTLNLADDRSLLDLQTSYRTNITPSISNGEPWRWDDFTSSVTTTIRTVSWQGGYCAQRLPLPVGPPRPNANAFQVWFYSDRNGSPVGPSGALAADVYSITLSPAEAHEQFLFETAGSEADCASYDYTAVLPIPVSVMAGTRYWLLIRAEIIDLRIPWGWRAGLADNGISAWGSLRGISLSGRTSTSPKDLAFSLSSQ